jgi:hypothetical protein
VTLQALAIRPGVVKDDTPTAAQGYLTSSDKILFWLGRAQAWAGYRTLLAAAIVGKARQVLDWAANDGTPQLAIGTASKLYVYREGRVFDITPQRAQGDFGNNPKAVTSGSPIVTLTLTAHGATTGDYVVLRDDTSTGGIILGGGGDTLTNPFTAIEGSHRLQVTHVAHGLRDNDIAYYSGASTLAGILDTYLNRAGGHRVQVVNSDTYYVWADAPADATATGGGTVTAEYGRGYEVTVLGANTFTVVAGGNALTTTTGGGNSMSYDFDVSIGRPTAAGVGGGFGSGPFGSGPFGYSTTPSNVGTSAPIVSRMWTFAAWGQNLIANIRGAGIYEWVGTNPSARAAILSNAPAQCNAIVVTPQRSILALGCSDTNGDFDPLLIRNCQTENNTLWTPAIDNNAGVERAQAGTKLVAGMVTSRGILVGADTAMLLVEFIGLSDQTYRSTVITAEDGVAGPNVIVESGGRVYWLTGSLMIFAYDGGYPEPITCPLHTWLLTELDIVQIETVFAFPDRTYPAACWLFKSLAGDDCDSYIRFDHGEARRDPFAGWSHGTWDRTVWSTRAAYKYPIAISSAGDLCEHNNEMGADGEPIARHIELALAPLADGEETSLVSRFVPDIAGTIQDWDLTVFGRDYPKSQEIADGPYPIDARKVYQDLHLRIRHVGYRFDLTTSDFWRLGAQRHDISEGGQR